MMRFEWHSRFAGRNRRMGDGGQRGEWPRGESAIGRGDRGRGGGGGGRRHGHGHGRGGGPGPDGGDDGRGGGGGGRRGRGRGGRYFGRGDLRLVLLSLIAEKPRHGYDLILSIAESTGGVYRPSPGVVYPTLTLLEDLGHVRTTTDADGRRLHEITAEGRAFLDAHRVSLAGMQSRIPGRRPPEVEAQLREVRTAMEQLKQALRATLAAGPVEASRLVQIVATIEQAARDIAAGEPS